MIANFFKLVFNMIFFCAFLMLLFLGKQDYLNKLTDMQTFLLLGTLISIAYLMNRKKMRL